MNKNIFIKPASIILLLFLVFIACKEENYTLGDLTKPTNLVINTTVMGQNTANPYGDGSGIVKINVKADNAISYKIGYSEVGNPSSEPSFELVTKETIEKAFNKLGSVNYRITVIAYGKGGTSTLGTKDITVKSVFNPDPIIVTNLTNDTAKTWKVDESVAGHFGVGPWSISSVVPEWWSASVNDKVGCCNCFYTAKFTFTKVNASTFTIKVASPDGVFTKTGSLASIPGIPASGDEGCYSYGGGAGSFAFIGATSGIASTTDNPTTKTSILLDGNTTFIGYGALKKEFEIMQITPTYMYLRVQGTETGNAWYLKLKPAP